MTLESLGGSFRDPTGRVLDRDGRILRGLTEEGAKGWRALRDSGLLEADGLRDAVVATTEAELPPEAAAQGWTALLEHERLPFVSYPYEWTHGMLRDAADLTLRLLEAALDAGLILKDATPYNVQWRGSRPVFVDVGSFRPLRPGEAWAGYRQFCTLFLYPLMLRAYAGVDPHPWLRGALEGIAPAEMRALLRGRAAWRRGVLAHVRLHARLERRSAGRTTRETAGELERAGFRTDLIARNVRGLRRLLGALDWRVDESAWTGYRDSQSYSDEAHAEKAEVVAAAAREGAPRLAWDLGANDGLFARALADAGAYVVALDSDHAVVERLYRALRAARDERILPLVMDLTAPSPDLGWRRTERRALEARGRPDLVACLALVHHLTLTHSIPLSEVVAWLAGLGARVVVELPHPDDPMVLRLMEGKPAADRHPYSVAEFERHLGGAFAVEHRRELAGGTRTLYVATPLASP